MTVDHITASSLPRLVTPLNTIRDAPRNSNVMPVHKYAALKKFIARNGLAQEIVVYREDPTSSEWVITDGHHRVRALRELWDPSSPVPCLDASGLTTVERIELTLSLNNNRGQLDLSLVSTEIDFLLEAGRELVDLDVTGFTIDELEALSGATLELDEASLLDDAMATEVARDKPDKVFVLEVTLATARELKLAKGRLRRAGGKGNRDLAKGFRAIAGLDGDDQ
ncbi:MAG: hypothetical protein COA94_06090 [Rickettsiales bacterium]|nr:MAG: hypothetical protein COA94_06090 [Rickettsiales bacterium]